jgi:hypothetical protein
MVANGEGIFVGVYSGVGAAFGVAADLGERDRVKGPVELPVSAGVDGDDAFEADGEVAAGVPHGQGWSRLG